MRAGIAVRAVAFPLAMRAGIAVRATAFQLTMRAPLCTHVASPSIPRGRLPQGNPRIPLTSTPGASGNVPVEVETSHFEKGKSHEARSQQPWRGPPRDSTAMIRSLRKRRETTRKQVRSRFKTLSQPRFAASPKPPAQSRARRRVDRSTPRAPRRIAFAPRSAPRRIASHARLRREIQPPASVRAFKSAIAACRDPRPARPPRGDTRSTREPPPVTRTPHTP